VLKKEGKAPYSDEGVWTRGSQKPFDAAVPCEITTENQKNFNGKTTDSWE